MYHSWDSIVRPVLDAVKPATIVEVGAGGGMHSLLLLQYLREHGGQLHIIDPHPGFDPAILKRAFGDAVHFHRALSVEALPQIKSPDIVLIDGDHNYATVSQELAILAAGKENTDAPCILLHDTGWPYGRRDMYHSPERIDSGRNTWARSGLVPGENTLHPWGMNPRIAHAVQEGGPRNGVLTAIEDFLRTSGSSWRFVDIPGLHGLGILTTASREDASPPLQALLTSLRSKGPLRNHLTLVEKERIEERMRCTLLERALLAAQAPAQHTQQVSVSTDDTSQYGECSVLRQLMSPETPRFVVDVGAHDGVSLSNARPFILEGWEAILIEPHPRIFQRLHKRYEKSPHVRCLQKACANRTGVEPFHMPSNGRADAGTLLQERDEFSRLYRSGESVIVETDTLTNMLAAHGVPARFGLLLIDAEGLDCEVLESLDFSRFRPEIIVTEESQERSDLRRQQELLAREGYTLVAVTGCNEIWTLRKVPRSTP